jgi:hypothetical protein
MSSERCVHGCQPPYYRLGEPCAACRAWHDEAMDRSFEEYRLEQESDRQDAFVPATDAEWRMHLDQVAPVVIETDPFTFTFIA